MGLYQRYVLPRLTHWSMGQRQLAPYRSRVVGAAVGRVLEIGIGSGRNLPFYTDRATEIIGVDPSPEMLAIARKAAGGRSRRVELIEGSAERLPLDDRSVDTVVVTWSLCSVPDVRTALREARGVLRPGGRLLFAEHGRSPDESVRRWQDRLTPLWAPFSGGCHLNRKPDDLIAAAGFDLIELRTGYARGPRPMTYMYEGAAAPA